MNQERAWLAWTYSRVVLGECFMLSDHDARQCLDKARALAETGATSVSLTTDTTDRNTGGWRWHRSLSHKPPRARKVPSTGKAGP